MSTKRYSTTSGSAKKRSIREKKFNLIPTIDRMIDQGNYLEYPAMPEVVTLISPVIDTTSGLVRFYVRYDRKRHAFLSKPSFHPITA
jgi:NADH:ubiquinone oxidoreductase subunit E